METTVRRQSLLARIILPFRHSISAQIGLFVGVAMTFVAVLGLLIGTWQQRKIGRDILMRQAYSIGKIVAAGSSDGVTFSELRLLRRTVESIEHLPDFHWLIIRNQNGDTLYTRHFSLAPQTIRAGVQFFPPDSVFVMPLNDEGVVVSAPIQSLVGNDRIGDVLIGLQPAVIQDGIERARYITILLTMLSLIITSLAVILIAMYLTKPLRELYNVSESVLKGDLTARANVVQGITSHSEPGILTQSFNQMLDKLETAQHQAAKTNSELEVANAQLEFRTMALSTANDEIQSKNITLAELNAEKDEFLGMASHDLKNPIVGIQGLSELLSIEDFESEQVKQMAKIIYKSSEKMFALVQNLLDVNALEQNGKKINLESFNIIPLLLLVADLYKSRGVEKGISVYFNTPQAEIIAFADRSATEQVLDNLVSNALKYSPLGKTVWISIEQNIAQEEVIIAVRDEGPGLSETDLQKLFGKFARLSARPTGGEHSTGLGLSIAKKLVDQMQGRIWCESELGKGATFFVALPLDVPELPIAPPTISLE